SMLPMGVPDSDAPRNLLDAFRTAADGRAGVYAVMNGQILHGSHVFKQHSTEIDAFLSANAAPAGEIRESEVRWNTPAPVPSGEPKLVEQIDTHILPVRLTPDLDPSFFSVLLGYPKVILEAFGAGGVPARLESAVRDLIQSGTRVYITTQCPEGGVHLHKYEVGRRAEALGAISLGSRTFEDALGALMCGEL
ncbi:MAG: asparaginase, partial [Butyricicoccus sp.]